MADLNGIPIIGAPKNFTRAAADAIIVDRGLYDVTHFLVSQLQMMQNQPFPKWGEPLTLRRPVGAGMTVNTTVMLPPDEEAPDDDTPVVANDEPK